MLFLSLFFSILQGKICPMVTANTLGDAIRAKRKGRNMTLKELAKNAGLDVKAGAEYVKALETGRNKKPAGEKLMAIASALGIDYRELFLLAGYAVEGRTISRPETPEEILERLRLAQPMSIPVYPEFRVHAGANHEEPVDYIYRARSKEAKRNIEAYIVHGHCMVPVVDEGDVVIVDRDMQADNGDILLCLINNQLMCGRLMVDYKGERWLGNTEERVHLKECQASAVVIEVIKRLK